MDESTEVSENPTRDTIMESDPSKNEGWGTRNPTHRKVRDEWGTRLALSQIVGKRLTYAEVTGKVEETAF